MNFEKNTKSFEAFSDSIYSSVKHTTYFPVYDHLLSKYFGKDITFVEVGILEGGSLFMWKELFGKNARIIGIDINNGALRWIEDGFEIFIGSQSDPKFWKDFYSKVGKIDVLLDDGGHSYEQQIVTVSESVDHINDAGTIIIEDVSTSYLREYGGPSKYSFSSYAKNISDGIMYRNFNFNKRNNSEKNIWNVQFFESIIAFHIDKSLCAIDSKEVFNEGKNMPVSYFDYSAERSEIVKKMGKFARTFKQNKLVYKIFISLNKIRKSLLSLLSGNKKLSKYFKY